MRKKTMPLLDMGDNKFISVYLSPQIYEEIERICTLNFENRYPYDDWKGHFDVCVQWRRILGVALNEAAWNTSQTYKKIFRAKLWDGEIGTCRYKIVSSNNIPIIYVIDIKFNRFQFKGYKLILDEPNYRSEYSGKFKIRGGKNATKGRKVLKKLGSGYYLLKTGGHMTFVKPDKKSLLSPGKWFITATDFEDGKAYAQGSDNNIYEIDTNGNMRLSDKSLGDINNLLESRRAIPLGELMKRLDENRKKNASKKIGGKMVLNKFEREVNKHTKETGVKASKFKSGGTKLSVKNPDGGEMVFYSQKEFMYSDEVVKGLEKYGRLREMRTLR